MPTLTDQTILITGATGNLGRATALACAAHGARLALIARDPAALAELRAALGSEVDAEVFAVDLLQPAAVSAMVEQVVKRFGQINALAHLAGGFAMGPMIHDTTDADWERMLDLNLRTLLQSVRAVVPQLLTAGGGRIVTVSARAATRGMGHMGPYCAAKAAVISLTESLADELKQQGITVNCILPGTLDTPQNRAAMPDADHATWVPLEAVADVILFLVSDAARAITGASIPVYGRS